ncbi:hypothetical protein T11_12178 [Trichinella zimbabwensis]|uniref:Uncharacterized protein n=1 Tax=Trichinella zimbabwensis TaxID=268475 RepID=A0A0V1G741_9BILA|nr:hypothetical protein T11_12178 [Trichinella zimbabwensis]
MVFNIYTKPTPLLTNTQVAIHNTKLCERFYVKVFSITVTSVIVYISIY